MAERIQWEAIMKKRVYLEPEEWMSLGIKRVAQALRRYAPDSVQIVQEPASADLHIVHMVGDGQRKHWLEPQYEYAVIQYCLRTTELPDTKDWIRVWEGARAVWSYYDLCGKIIEDGHTTDNKIKFYFAPLGVDTGVFRPSMPMRKRYVIGTSGYIAETEGVKECLAVSNRLDKTMLHLGPNLNIGNGVVYISNCSDMVLADFWSQCSFIAGLRRIEGFELPVVEGLMCGARPIVFDAPHYKNWFVEFAEFIPEASPEETIENLYAIMSKPVRAVTRAEQSQAADMFDWEVLTAGFWEAIL